MSEFVWNQDELDAEQEGVVVEHEGQVTKTSRKLPEVWTRIISIYGDDLTKVKSYHTSTDLLLVAGFEPEV